MLVTRRHLIANDKLQIINYQLSIFNLKKGVAVVCTVRHPFCFVFDLFFIDRGSV